MRILQFSFAILTYREIRGDQKVRCTSCIAVEYAEFIKVLAWNLFVGNARDQRLCRTSVFYLLNKLPNGIFISVHADVYPFERICYSSIQRMFHGQAVDERPETYSLYTSFDMDMVAFQINVDYDILDFSQLIQLSIPSPVVADTSKNSR